MGRLGSAAYVRASVCPDLNCHVMQSVPLRSVGHGSDERGVDISVTKSVASNTHEILAVIMFSVPE